MLLKRAENLLLLIKATVLYVKNNVRSAKKVSMRLTRKAKSGIKNNASAKRRPKNIYKGYPGGCGILHVSAIVAYSAESPPKRA